MAKAKVKKIEVLSPEALRKALNEKWPNSTRMGNDPSLRIQRIPTGILSVDHLLGGGFARNRHAELYGDFSTGKTCVSFRFIAQAQSMGLTCAYIDAENTFDPQWAKGLGVKTKKLDLHIQESGEQCVDYMQTLLTAGFHDVVVLDSIAALLPISEREASAEDGTYGMQQAKLMSKAMRKLTTCNRKTAIIYINQTRESIGGSSFIKPPPVTSGGKAMGFYAGVRIEFTRIETIKRKGSSIDLKTGNESEADVPKGHRVMLTVRKDKTGGARQMDTGTFVYDYDASNIDPIEDLLYVGRSTGVIAKQGDWWSATGFEDERQNGRPKFKKWLAKNVLVQKELVEMIKGAA